MLAAGLPDWTGNGTGAAGWPEPGQTYVDPAGGVLVLVLTAPRWPGLLRCNGVAMLTAHRLPCGYHARPRIRTTLRPGLRYREPASGLEVRCLRAGHGQLTYSGQLLLAA
jgi:hypothetical protein